MILILHQNLRQLHSLILIPATSAAQILELNYVISKFHKVFQTLDEAEAFAKELGLSASEVLVEIYNSTCC